MRPAIPKVLVVEDDPAIRALFKAALAREAVHVDLASDGAEALDLTQRHTYAIVILDLLMPRMNGFQFLEAFQLASPHARTLIIVVSAFDDALLARLSSNRVHAIVRKPFDVHWLVELIRDLASAWSVHHRVTAQEPITDFAAPPERRP